MPPNREFLAVLGDNKRTRNCYFSVISTNETSLCKEAMLEMGGNGGGNTEVVLKLTAENLAEPF